MKSYTLYHYPHQARFGKPGPAAKCHVTVYDHLHGTVVVMTEPPDNPGMSITNAVEAVATQVGAREGLDPARTIWLEHYPDRHPPGMERDRMFDESYDLVRFAWAGLTATRPAWKRLDTDVADALMTGGAWVDLDGSDATIVNLNPETTHE